MLIHTPWTDGVGSSSSEKHLGILVVREEMSQQGSMDMIQASHALGCIKEDYRQQVKRSTYSFLCGT